MDSQGLQNEILLSLGIPVMKDNRLRSTALRSKIADGYGGRPRGAPRTSLALFHDLLRYHRRLRGGDRL